jgi:hypothetical protein
VIDWADIESEFIQDGGLLDFCVYQTRLQDWQCFLDLLRSYGIRHSYHLDGELSEFSWDASLLFSVRDHAHDFAFSIDGIVFHCHFFIEEEIELDFDPSDINGQATLNALVDFVEQIGEGLKKSVVITPESQHGKPILLYRGPVSGVEYLKPS